MTTPITSPLKTIPVALGDRSYDILIQPGILLAGGEKIAARTKGRRCLVVTDQNIGRSYGTKLASSLQKAGFDGSAAELPPGESTKTVKVAEFLYDRCIDAKLDRDSIVIALGGGVIGDLAGFVAATFYRGVPFVQIPTTLLAMVDASIGGKTGVDHPRSKNAIGAFHQPKAVLIDPLVLGTLPDRELRAGMAEVIKYGIIDDAELFTFLEEKMDRLLEKDAESLAHVIEKSAAIKARIVSQDEREQAGGPRALLNFGHTFGHAIESTTGYKKYLHGEAIGIGMCLAASLSVEKGLLSRADRDRIVALVRKAGLPTKVAADDPDTATLNDACSRDKKVAEGKVRFILTEKIGSAKVFGDVTAEMAKKVWDEGREG